MKYTYTSIYGFYVQQSNKKNGRNWYRNNVRAIWWNGGWFIGPSKHAGSKGGYGFANPNGACVPKSFQDMRKWKDEKIKPSEIKVRCGFRPTGMCALCSLGINITIWTKNAKD